MDNRPATCSECLRTARQWIANPQSLDELLGFCSDACQRRYEERQASEMLAPSPRAEATSADRPDE